MEYVLIAIISVVSIATILFLAANSYDAYKNFLDKENKSTGKFTEREWEILNITPKSDSLTFSSKWKELSANFVKNLYFPTFFSKKKKPEKIHHRELMKVLLGLDDEKLDELLELYKEEFGEGAARYARKTYRKWESGQVRPIKQTFERFLVHLPKVMSYDLKCEVLRHLMEEYCARDNYNLTVYADDWEETLEPLVKKIIDKPYSAALPAQIEKRLKWLAEDEMQIAEDILKRSQVEEGKIAVSMLRREFANIEEILMQAKGKPKVTHELKFPYGTINLEIKRK